MTGKKKGSKERKENPFYKEGNSKKEALDLLSPVEKKDNENFRGPNSPDTNLFGIDSDVKPLLHYQYAPYWQGKILENGRKIHEKLDILFNKVHQYNDSFYNRKGPIKKIFDSLLNFNTSLINFERDIVEFLTATSIEDHLVARNLQTSVTTILDQIKRTYSRTYDLCSLKLRSISNGRLSFFTISLSIVALIISLFSILKAPGS